MKPILAERRLVTKGDERAWAVTSPDDRYRYLLGRVWAGSGDSARDEPTTSLWCFAMLNPSKARHDVDDPTVRKCAGFAKRGGARGLVIVNMFAYSATDPGDMVNASQSGIDVVGDHNEAAIRWAISRPATLRPGRRVAAWGFVPPKLRNLAKAGICLFLVHPADCLGVNVDGSPKHPLRLGYDRPIRPWAENLPDRSKVKR
jgi:hypothetical protein